MNKEGYVYLLKAETGHYKIGRSKNVPKRMKLFAVKLPFRTELVHYFPCDDMYKAEHIAHKRSGHWHTRGEWFDLPAWFVNNFRMIRSFVDGNYKLDTQRYNWTMNNTMVRYHPIRSHPDKRTPGRV